MPYPGGMSRGDTPPREIPTTGAAGRKGGARSVGETSFGGAAPYYCDENARFASRSETMTFDVIHAHEVPRGPIKVLKAYQQSLVTEDIALAHPVMGHPTTSSTNPVPWSKLNKPPLPEIAGTKPMSKLQKAARFMNRPRDLSLTTGDIEGTLTRDAGLNSEGRARPQDRRDSVKVKYKFPSSEQDPPPAPRWSGRDSLNVSDIEGTKVKPACPWHREPRDHMRVEAEFRSRGARAAAVRQAMAGHPQPPPSAAASAAADALMGMARKVTPRGTNPLTPRYIVPVATEGCASLYARWDEEKTVQKGNPPVENQEIGFVEGSTSAHKIRDNGSPQYNLQTRDVPGARSVFRVGALPYSLWGPQTLGRRPPQSNSLNTADIDGAQANTVHVGPQAVAARKARCTPRFKEEAPERTATPAATPTPTPAATATTVADENGLADTLKDGGLADTVRTQRSEAGHQATVRFDIRSDPSSRTGSRAATPRAATPRHTFPQPPWQ